MVASPSTYATDAASPQGLASQAEERKDFGTGSTGKCAYWKAEIHACNKEMDAWRQRATQVVNRYRDDRAGQQTVSYRSKKYNMLWSIINTTMPAIYGKPPKPVVVRRHTDPDNVARVASMILERAIEFQIGTQPSFHAAVKNALQDRLLPGMGCAWVRFQQSQQSPTGTIDNDYYARLSGNMAAVDFVYWEDFGFIPARTWEEVPAVWRVVYMTKEQLAARFGEAKSKLVPLDYVPARHPNAASSNVETDEPKNVVFKQAKIYEIWDKRTSYVCWMSTAYEDLLDERADPVGFPNFFPCPKPLFATNTTGNLVPVPDYCMYQDQANEIDNLTQRLDMLTKALKVVGVYDSAQDQSVGRMLTEGVDNQMIPVDQWAAFAEKGGIKGTMDFLPLDTIIEVVERLFNIRQQLIQDIYQITGLSDIIRGASNPNETLGAQKIKAQFASVRLSALQQDLARFVTDILQLMGHIMVRFFDDATLVEQSSIMQSPDGQQAVQAAQAAMQQKMQPLGGGGGNVVPFPQPAEPGAGGVIGEALKLLRRGRMVDYRIEVASDSMIEPDLDAERDARNEFITAVTQFLQQALPAISENPQLIPVVKTLLMFGVRGFRVGRDVEGIIDSTFTQMQNNPQPQKPDPKAEAAQAKAQGDQAKVAGEIQKMQQEAGLAQQEMQAKLEMMQQEMAQDREAHQQEMQQMHEKTQAEIKAILIKAFVDVQTKRDKAAADAEAKAVEVEASVERNEQEMEMKGEQHEQSMEMAEKEKSEAED